MKNYKTLLLLFFLLALPLYVWGTVTSERTSEKGRETTLLNRLWKYKQGDVAGGGRTHKNNTEWGANGLCPTFCYPSFLFQNIYFGFWRC